MFVQMLIYVDRIIDEYNLQIIRGMFLTFTLIISISGGLVIILETITPECVKRLVLYGKLGEKYVTSERHSLLLLNIEIPKSWFSHFYIFAMCWSFWGFYLILQSIINQQPPAEYILKFLDFMGGGHNNRAVLTNSTSAMVVMLLMLLQTIRRFYETNFVQIFSKKNRINIGTYIVGYLHYFGVTLAFLLHTEGFVRDSWPSSFNFNKITKLQYLWILIFLFSWLQQWKLNMILVNLRRDAKSGKKTNTEQHFIPRGGLFNLVSAPHMLVEVIMYVCVYGIIPENVTFRFILIFVIINQVVMALLNHKWYKQNFPDYPKHRKALIPFIL